MNLPFRYQNLTRTITFSAQEQAIINGLGQLNGSEWDGDIKAGCTITKAQRNKVTSDIKGKSEAIQGKYCIYCGIHEEYKGHLQREHILRKSATQYPNFMFEPENLVLACGHCNRDLKGLKDFGSGQRDNYQKNSFKIIHPHLDDFNNHIRFFGKGNQVLVQKIPYSRKGKKTIEVFELASVPKTTMRSGLIDQYEKYIDPKFNGPLNGVFDRKYFN
jgi:uncharacterized protein (TIGR02646 family)